MNKKLKRGHRLDLNTCAEMAVRNAITEVEKLGADERLTDIIIMLSDALRMLGDYIDDSIVSTMDDGPGGNPDGPRPPKP